MSAGKSTEKGTRRNVGMADYTPDRWMVLEFSFPDGRIFYKVLGTWVGGFTTGDSWRLNSGIVRGEDLEDCWVFHGYSGSAYVCSKGSLGTSMYTHGILEELINSTKVNPERPSIRPIPGDEIPSVIEFINNQKE